jgi:hypothetical protein
LNKDIYDIIDENVKQQFDYSDISDKIDFDKYTTTKKSKIAKRAKLVWLIPALCAVGALAVVLPLSLFNSNNYKTNIDGNSSITDVPSDSTGGDVTDKDGNNANGQLPTDPSIGGDVDLVPPDEDYDYLFTVTKLTDDNGSTILSYVYSSSYYTDSDIVLRIELYSISSYYTVYLLDGNAEKVYSDSGEIEEGGIDLFELKDDYTYIDIYYPLNYMDKIRPYTYVGLYTFNTSIYIPQLNEQYQLNFDVPNEYFNYKKVTINTQETTQSKLNAALNASNRDSILIIDDYKLPSGDTLSITNVSTSQQNVTMTYGCNDSNYFDIILVNDGGKAYSAFKGLSYNSFNDYILDKIIYSLDTVSSQVSFELDGGYSATIYNSSKSTKDYTKQFVVITSKNDNSFYYYTSDYVKSQDNLLNDVDTRQLFESLVAYTNINQEDIK